MGCNNDADTRTLRSARTAGDASCAIRRAHDVRQQVANAQRATVAIDRTGDLAILRARAGHGKPSASERAAYGDVAESGVARAIVEEFGQHIVHMNTKPHEQGIDIVSYDEETNSLVVWEVKSSLSASAINRAPRMGRTNDGRQMSTGWLNERLAAAGLDQAEAADIEARAVKVDLLTGKACVWTLDVDTGAKVKGDPFSIDDLLDLKATD